MQGVLLRASLLLALGPGLGLGVSMVRGTTVMPAEQPPPMCEAPAVAAEEIPPEAAAELCRTSNALIVDVRSRAEFERGHIPNAIHLPCIEGDIEDAAALLDRAEILLVYGATTEDARPVASTLLARGWPAKLLLGGYDAWAQAGLACASGPCEGCENQAPNRSPDDDAH
ncbi:MAG: rhodanese-like domain-containing protein [Deltaproteobacteria bacterium]|nr:rhodanese-like domain-containing protein [Deltaproteobacteria bacterium]